MKKLLLFFKKALRVVRELWGQIMLLGALLIGFIFCYKSATEQLSPRLKQLNLSCNNTDFTSIERIEMVCMLNDNGIGTDVNKSRFCVTLEMYRDSSCLKNMHEIQLPPDYPFADSSEIVIVNGLTFRSFDTSVNLDKVDQHYDNYEPFFKSRLTQISPYEVAAESYARRELLTYAEINVVSDNLWTPDDKNNPYINLYLKFDQNLINKIEGLSAKSYIGFAFWDKYSDGKLQTPVNFINVYPEPDNMNPERIEYTTKESIIKAIRNGIYILAEDTNKRTNSENYIFLITLIMGVLLSLLVTVINNMISSGKNIRFN